MPLSNQNTEIRLFRLNIEVANLAQATSFYAALLGSEGRPQMGGRCYFEAGGVTLQVVETATPQLAAKALYFATSDLDRLHAIAGSLGCLADDRVHGESAGEALVRPWGERSFYCNDPSGNPLCFVEDGTIYSG